MIIIIIQYYSALIPNGPKALYIICNNNCFIVLLSSDFLNCI